MVRIQDSQSWHRGSIPLSTTENLREPIKGSLSFFLEYERAVAHATRGRNRRNECRERSYYHLHCHLNDPLLRHNSVYSKGFVLSKDCFV